MQFRHVDPADMLHKRVGKWNNLRHILTVPSES